MEVNAPLERTRLEALAEAVIVTTMSAVDRHHVARRIGAGNIEIEIEDGLISEFTADFYEMLTQRTAGAGTGRLGSRHPSLRSWAVRAAEQGANAILEATLTYQGHAGRRARFLLGGTFVELAPD